MSGARTCDESLTQSTSESFSNWTFVKLCTELQDDALIIRQRALTELCDVIHDPERAYEVIITGCMERFKLLLQDEDELCRIKTTEGLYILTAHSLGRDAIYKHDMMGLLIDLLDDPVDVCRRNVHKVLNRMTEFPSEGVFMLSMGLVPRLVQKISVEEENIRALILLTLSSCIVVNPQPALESDVIAVLRDQLCHPSADIRKSTTSALVGLSVPVNGKVKVCEEDLLPLMVSLLSDDDQGVVANAAGTIMNTAVITRGKHEALKAGAIDPLLRLVMSDNRAVCANALRALTVLAEVPKARAQLLEHVSLLNTRLHHPDSIIQRAACTAIEVISWKP